MSRTTTTVPDVRAVWNEQLRTVAAGMRWELIGAAVLLGVPTLVAAAWQAGMHGSLTLDPSDGYGWVLGLAGVLFPLAVWKDEQRFGDSHLWALPVARRRHALLKVGTGWAILMASVAAVVAWMVAVTLVTGGTLGDETTRMLLVDRALAEAGAGGIETVEWTTRWWQWLIPFTAATVAYLFGSALLLATPRPWWWVGGGFLLLVVLGTMSEELDLANELFERLVFGPVFHPLGLDTVMTSGWDSLTTAVQRPDGEWVGVWRAMPALGRWVAATTLWTAIGSIGLWAASMRHREG